MTFQVRDDFGKPVPGAIVGISTFEKWIPSEGFGQSTYKAITSVTDTNGLATVEAVSPESSVSYGVRPKFGDYTTSGADYYFRRGNTGRWEPWNPTVDLVLKPIVNPVPMYARAVETNIPKPGQKYGFDLMAGDWVAPSGRGKTTDMIFEVTGYAASVNDYDSTLTVSFANPRDGIQSFLPTQGCEFRSPRQAPLDGYQSQLTFRRARKPGQLSPDRVDDTQNETNYLFRVRTILAGC